MKKLLSIFLLSIAFIGLSLSKADAQVKISDMTTYSGNPAGGWVPVVIGGQNYKVNAKNFGGSDSISVSQGPSYDTLWMWKLGVKAYYKLTRGASATPSLTLDDVAQNGNTTTTTIGAANLSLNYASASSQVNLLPNLITGTKNLFLPNASDTLADRSWVRTLFSTGGAYVRLNGNDSITGQKVFRSAVKIGQPGYQPFLSLWDETNSRYAGINYNDNTLSLYSGTGSVFSYLSLKALTTGRQLVIPDYNDTIAGMNWVRTQLSGSSLPSQTGNAGKFLTTNGSSASWNTIKKVYDNFGDSILYAPANAQTKLIADSSSITIYDGTGMYFDIHEGGHTGQIQFHPSSIDVSLKDKTFAIKADSLTSGRTYQLPDESGVLALKSDITGGSTAKVYRALITQTGTNDPVATVLENTLGVTITWTRSASGDYIGTPSSGSFDIEKTFYSPTYSYNYASGVNINAMNNVSNIEIITNDGASNTDGLLAYWPIEIIYYP